MTDNKIGVIIADSDVSFTGRLKSYIDGEDDFKVSRIVHSGDMVNRAFEETDADILIMDIILPVMDGFSVLKQLEKLTRRPSLVIVVSVMGHELLVKKAAEAGADYYVMKPLDFQTFIERIRYFGNAFSSKSEKEKIYYEKELPKLNFNSASLVAECPLPVGLPAISIKKETTRLLHEIGVPANLKGHNYLRDAVLMVFEDRRLVNFVTKTVYPTIGKKYQTSPCSVERAIRTALETAWSRGKTEILNNLFGFTVNIDKGKPTNAEFIALIADKLSLDCS